MQIPIALRPLITTAVAAAIAESGCADACLALMKNCDADVSLHSVERIVTRFGNVAAEACEKATVRLAAETPTVAFRAGLAGLREGLPLAEAGGAGRLKRRLVERVLVVCSDERCAQTLLALLRRFALEAAREEARLFCDELIAEGSPLPRVRSDESRLVALGFS